MQPRCDVAGEPDKEFAGRVEPRADRVAPVGLLEYCEVLLHDAVALLGGASASVRGLGRQMVGDDRGVDVPTRCRRLPGKVSGLRARTMGAGG